MSLKEYATEQENIYNSQIGDWKVRADAALHKFQLFFLDYIKHRIDSASRCQKGKTHILSTKYQKHVSDAVPLIEILYYRKSSNNRIDLPRFNGIDRSSELRNSMVISVNNQEEADYCAERIKKMLLSEGIKIDACRRIRSGLVIKYEQEGYVIWYTFEW